MATEKKYVFEFDTQFKGMTIAELQKEVTSLRQGLKDLEVGSEEAAEQSKKLSEAQTTLRHAMAGADKDAQLANKSYDALAQQMKQLQNAWKATTDEAERKALGKQIKKLNDELKDMDASVGNFQRNVGNYQSALEGMGGSLGGVTKGLGNMKKVLDLLKAHPIITIIAIVTALVMALYERIKNMEGAMNQLKMATSALEPIMKVFNKILDVLATALAKVFTLIIDKVVVAFKKLLSAADEVGKFFGKDWGLEAKFENASASAQNYEKRLQELKKTQREFVVEEAMLNNEVADLRAKATDKEKYSAKERERFLEDALKKEELIAKQRYEIAEEEFEILKHKARLAENSAEENDALAQAEAKMYQEKTAYLEKQRSLNKELNRYREEVKANEKAVQEAREKDAEARRKEEEERRKEEEERAADIKARQDALLKELRESKMTEEEKDLEALQEWYENAMALFTENEEVRLSIEEEYNNRRMAILEKYKAKVEETNNETTEDTKLSLKEQYDAFLQKHHAEVTLAKTSATAIVDILDALADAQDTSTKKGFENQKKMKIASATIEMLVGIVSAMSNAIRDLGFPVGPIVGAIQATALAVAGGVQIAKIKQQKYNSSSSASGGINLSNASTSASANVSQQALQDMSASVQGVRNITGASEERQMSSQRVYVVETDIRETGRRVEEMETAARW